MHPHPAIHASDTRTGALPAELELLRECVRGALPGAEPSSALPALLARVNWHHVIWHGRSHRALPFLREALATVEPALRPPGIWAQLTQFEEANQFRSLERGRELCLVQDVLNQAGVGAIAMNGWAFAQRYYPKPVLRDIGQKTEFLVDPADEGRAEQALTAVGYAFGDDLLRLDEARRSRVMLHTTLSGDAHTAAIPFAAIQSRAEAWSVGGRTLTILSTRDWLYQLAWRSANAGAGHLLRSFDVSILAQRLPPAEWPEVLEEARRARLETPLLLGLATGRALFGHALPEVVSARVQAHARVRTRAALQARSLNLMGEERWATLRTQVAMQWSWSARLRVISRFVRAKLWPARLPGADGELAYIGRFAPTPPPVVRAMLRLAGTGADDVVYDLGCGDGRMVIVAAKEFGARGVGLDIDPQRIATAQAAAAAAGVSERVTLQCADVLKTPITDATVVCLYLQGFAYPALRRKLERELPRGTRLLSHNFVFPGWPPEKAAIVRSSPGAASYIYFWRT